ncbi:hypothetical protein AVEN_178839-1 [Araneus ventricosus]|uniref:Uncharacterized protein n=1 Tax=Araneus ventricosus TaxID=182803 RepID=A0A4Y2BEE2_ARAVE|nr:hypothetical protein AVEN_178839-1 [Araneus ventricosus]
MPKSNRVVSQLPSLTEEGEQNLKILNPIHQLEVLFKCDLSPKLNALPTGKFICTHLILRQPVMDERLVMMESPKDCTHLWEQIGWIKS